MIELSYFRSLAPQERKVCIAKFPPRYWRGPRAPMLAPSQLAGPDWQGAYWRDLEERFPGGAGLAEYLAKIAARTAKPILCCYEANPLNCHRSVLARYAIQTIGLELAEWADQNSLI